MVVIGVFQGRRVVLNTASVLAMDDARRFLSWESTFSLDPPNNCLIR